jgi:acyl-CoA thioesterase FadM
MSRVVLEEQQSYEFIFETFIQTRDLNYAGHLGNDSLISIIQDARIAIFKELGFEELDLGDKKTGIIIGDLLVNFKSEGFSGDKIKIESHIDEIKDRSIRLYHKILKMKNNEILALAETGLIAFDYAKREISSFPEQFMLKLKRIQQ